MAIVEPADFTTSGPPRPKPSAMTAPFWDAARSGVLVRPRCACGRSFFTPQVVCPECRRDDWVWTPSSGLGTVYSYTIVHRAPAPGFEVPYVLAIVDLEESWSMLANVVGCPTESVRIGLPVHVVFRSWPDGFVLPCFGPRAGPEAVQ